MYINFNPFLPLVLKLAKFASDLESTQATTPLTKLPIYQLYSNSHRKLAQNQHNQQNQQLKPYSVPGSESHAVNILGQALNPFAGPAGAASQIAYESGKAVADHPTLVKAEITRRHVHFGNGGGVLLGIREVQPAPNRKGYLLFIGTADHVIAGLAERPQRDNWLSHESSKHILDSLRKSWISITLFPDVDVVTQDRSAGQLFEIKPGTPYVHSNPVRIVIRGNQFVYYYGDPYSDNAILVVYVDPQSEMFIRRSDKPDRELLADEARVFNLPIGSNELHVPLNPQQKKALLDHLSKTIPDAKIVSPFAIPRIFGGGARVYGASGMTFPTPFLGSGKVFFGGPGIVRYMAVPDDNPPHPSWVSVAWDIQREEFSGVWGSSGSGLYAVLPGPDGPQVALIGYAAAAGPHPELINLNPPVRGTPLRDYLLRRQDYRPYVELYEESFRLLPNLRFPSRMYYSPVYAFARRYGDFQAVNEHKYGYRPSTYIIDRVMPKALSELKKLISE
jgi:hypothetical protein